MTKVRQAVGALLGLALLGPTLGIGQTSDVTAKGNIGHGGVGQQHGHSGQAKDPHAALHHAMAIGPDWDGLAKELEETGLEGAIHGSAADLRQFVFTYYPDPDFIFTGINFSVTTEDEDLLKELAKTKRHDWVKIKGKLVNNPSPQKHIELEAIKIITPYNPGMTMPKFNRTAKIPDDLKGHDQFLGVVHAIDGDGHVLVMEYKDTVIPVFAKDNSLTKDLYRGDKIRVHYRILAHPEKPTHLALDAKAAKAVEAVSLIKKTNGTKATLEGELVLFPKSPQIRFPVFAMRVTDSDGLSLNYTFLNRSLFEATDAESAKKAKEDLMKIHAKVRKPWDAKIASAVNGRNCLVNPKIRVRAKGSIQVISPAQANPQILLNDESDVEILP